MKIATHPRPRPMRKLGSGQRSQQGAILAIAMIMLVLITMISLTVIRSATVEEKMAGNSRDRDKAFQAAEAAMRICLARLADESYTGTSPTAQLPAAAGTVQVWAPNSANWADDTIAAPVSTANIDLAAYGLSASPRCIYETLGTGTGSYRVTTLAKGAQDATAVILQATYTNE